ncbi:MAG TPA: type II secretion system protein [Dehalococcoidia bacterium]|nr:type II secretion system protein [Dehalococcoidia bacterium]
MRTGWTPLEVLVVLGITGALVALLIVGVSAARQRGRDAVSASNLSQHTKAMTAYADDHREFYPYFTEVGFMSGTLTGGGVTVEGVSFFDAHCTWHIVLADSYYRTPAWSGVFYPPRFPESEGSGAPWTTPYFYGCCFIAEPAYWDRRTRTGADQFRGNRVSHVVFPSAKALIIESWPFAARVRTPADAVQHALPVTTCDGGVRALAWDRRMGGHELGDGYHFAAEGAVHYTDFPPLLHTLDGVRGRDVR